MNIPPGLDWRNKRSLNHLSIQSVNYSTYSLPDFTENKNMKSEFYDMYNPDMKTFPDMATDKKFDGKSAKSEPWLIRSALQVCASIFRKISGRASSPDLCYHDCESVARQEPPPSRWQGAKTQNKSIEAQTDSRSDMNGDYKSVVASCEDKLNKVRQLITSKPVPSSPKCTTYKSRRRRRVFVEPGSVEDSFEDAFSPDDFICSSNSDAISIIIPYQYQKCEYFEVDAPKMKIETAILDLKKGLSVPENKKDLYLETDVVKTEIVEHVEPEETNKSNIETVSSCESKIMQLQAMLKERRKKNTKTTLDSSVSAPEPVKDPQNEQTKPKVIPVPKIQDKKYKNRHRLSTGKRKKVESRKLIQDDMLFANEIAEEPEEPSSFENSPIISVELDKSVESLGTPSEDCFDEVAGRFRSTSGTESDDSFQVVFADSPRAMRPSDCESEDSFIIFEESPDSCYTSNDVFGDDSESEYSDTDSEVSDSGCGDSDELKMSQNMTKTFGDLTDDKIYEEKDEELNEDKDEVDNAVNMCVVIPDEVLETETEVVSTGLLLDDAKKLKRKNQPPKKVQFSTAAPRVHVLRVWALAARLARPGHWERYAVDRERFRRRIADADMALSWVLKPQHRSRVMFQRFMPWWNQLRRKEIAEKKEMIEKNAREEQKRLEEARREEERLKEDETKKDEGIETDIAEDDKLVEDNDRLKIGEQTKIDMDNQINVRDSNSSDNVNTVNDALSKDDDSMGNGMEKLINNINNSPKEVNSKGVNVIKEVIKRMLLNDVPSKDANIKSDLKITDIVNKNGAVLSDTQVAIEILDTSPVAKLVHGEVKL